MQIIHFQGFEDLAGTTQGHTASQYSSFLFTQPFHLL